MGERSSRRTTGHRAARPCPVGSARRGRHPAGNRGAPCPSRPNRRGRRRRPSALGAAGIRPIARHLVVDRRSRRLPALRGGGRVPLRRAQFSPGDSARRAVGGTSRPTGTDPRPDRGPRRRRGGRPCGGSVLDRQPDGGDRGCAAAPPDPHLRGAGDRQDSPHRGVGARVWRPGNPTGVHRHRRPHRSSGEPNRGACPLPCGRYVDTASAARLSGRPRHHTPRAVPAPREPAAAPRRGHRR